MSSTPEDVAAQVAALFRRSAPTVPAPSVSVVDAAIRTGEGRARRRRRRHLVELTGSAAVAGAVIALAAVGPLALGGGETPTTSQASTATAAGVPGDQVGSRLAEVLSTSLSAPARREGTRGVHVASGTLPSWAVEVSQRLHRWRPPSSRPPSRRGSVSYRQGSVDIEVAIAIDPPAPHVSASSVTIEGLRDYRAIASATTAGTLLRIGPAEPAGARGIHDAMASLVTDDGWVIQVMTSDTRAVPMETLSLIALDDAWLR